MSLPTMFKCQLKLSARYIALIWQHGPDMGDWTAQSAAQGILGLKAWVVHLNSAHPGQR